MAQPVNNAPAGLAGLNLANLVGSWAAETLGITRSSEPSRDRDDPLAQIAAERAAMRGLQSQAWDIARLNAANRANALGLAEDDPARMPSMTDYLVATQSDVMKAAVAASNPPVQWTPAAIVNFDGQTMENVQVRRADFDPAQITPEIRESLGMTEDEISEFYAEVSAHVTFDETRFYNVHFHPADTFDHYVKGRADAVVNCTFDGMGTDDVVRLEAGRFEGIRFTDIRGGHIEVADGTQVRGMDISGAHASLTIGRASVSSLDATGAHIVELRAAPGARIDHATFEGATISMASELNGIQLSDVHFEQANLREVNLRGSTLTNVSFNETQLAGLDLSDATLRNLLIDGEPVRDVHQLAAMGVTVNESTRIESVREVSLREAEIAPQTAIEALTELAARRPDPAEIPAAPAPQHHAFASLQLEDVGFGDFNPGHTIAQMPRNADTVAREQAQAEAIAHLPPR